MPEASRGLVTPPPARLMRVTSRVLYGGWAGGGGAGMLAWLGGAVGDFVGWVTWRVFFVCLAEGSGSLRVRSRRQPTGIAFTLVHSMLFSLEWCSLLAYRSAGRWLRGLLGLRVSVSAVERMVYARTNTKGASHRGWAGRKVYRMLRMPRLRQAERLALFLVCVLELRVSGYGVE